MMHWAFLFSLAVSNSVIAEDSKLFRLDDPLPEGKESFYSSRVTYMLRDWPLKDAPELRTRANPFWIKGIKTPDKPLYIGVLKQVWIKAPIQKVSSLIEDFESYPRLFEGVKTVKILGQERNKLTVFWERETPVFFVPNVKFQQIYLVDHSQPNRVVYRYQLKEANSLRNSDGLIVLEADGDGTRQTGLDFYNAEWGILGSVASGKIWKESLEGTFLGDYSLKFKAEHPEWQGEEIAKSAREMLKRFPIEPIQYIDRFPWEDWKQRAK